jgi:hypothetical protein
LHHAVVDFLSMQLLLYDTTFSSSVALHRCMTDCVAKIEHTG